jgi:hypothetical protein
MAGAGRCQPCVLLHQRVPPPSLADALRQLKQHQQPGHRQRLRRRVP